MQKLFICENETCEQVGVEFVLTDPQRITTCGGCGVILEGANVDE
jgi:hypothetical protein